MTNDAWVAILYVGGLRGSVGKITVSGAKLARSRVGRRLGGCRMFIRVRMDCGGWRWLGIGVSRYCPNRVLYEMCGDGDGVETDVT